MGLLNAYNFDFFNILMNVNPTTNNEKLLWLKAVSILVALGIGVYLLFSFIAARAEKYSLLPVSFVTSNGKETSKFYTAIVSTPAEQERGLMYVKKLDPNKGMIFVYNEEEQRSFWMKNTYVSLDIFFLDRYLKVLGIKKAAEILSEKPIEIAGAKSMYVLELPAGTADKHGIGQGDTLVLHGPIPKAIPDLRKEID
jgi:uncharacterized membrane protein (UPF0127 family)